MDAANLVNMRHSNHFGGLTVTAYKALLEQRAALDAQIAEAKQKESAAAIQKARELVNEYGLTSEDVFGGKKARGGAKGTTVAPKYRDPATGATWSGRGKPPTWIKDKDRSTFAI